MSATECGFRSRYFFPQKPQCRIGQIYATKTTVKGGWYSSKTKKISLKCLVQLTSDYTNLSSVYICKNENGFCAKKTFLIRLCFINSHETSKIVSKVVFYNLYER